MIGKKKGFFSQPDGLRLYEVRNLKGQNFQLLLNETKPFFLLLTYEKSAKEKWLCD